MSLQARKVQAQAQKQAEINATESFNLVRPLEICNVLLIILPLCSFIWSQPLSHLQSCNIVQVHILTLSISLTGPWLVAGGAHWMLPLAYTCKGPPLPLHHTPAACCRCTLPSAVHLYLRKCPVCSLYSMYRTCAAYFRRLPTATWTWPTWTVPSVLIADLARYHSLILLLCEGGSSCAINYTISMQWPCVLLPDLLRHALQE